MSDFKLETIPNEELGDAIVELYGFKFGVHYDSIISNTMRDHMLTEEDRTVGFGMADSYRISLVENPAQKAIVILWKSKRRCKITGPHNFYSGQPTQTALSIAANLIALSNLSFHAAEPYNQNLSNAYHVFRQCLLQKFCPIAGREDIDEAFSVCD